MRKKVLLFLILGLTTLGVWYFGIKDYNYLVRFETAEPRAVVYDFLKNWNDGWGYEDTVVRTLKTYPFQKLEQQFKSSDSVFNIEWDIRVKDDGGSQVIGKFSDPENGFKQNIEALYSKNNFVKRSITFARDVGDGLVESGKAFNINPVVIDTIPSSHCICTKVRSEMDTKTAAMTRDIQTVMGYINLNGIQIAGDPRLDITMLDLETGMVEFDFCFPVPEEITTLNAPDIFLKDFEEKPALRSVFNGNYRISYLAWMHVMDYAEHNGYAVDITPHEVFLNDPHVGSNALEWEAYIHFPLRN